MTNAKKIIFFGAPEFAVPALQALAREGYNIVLVVTQPIKPAGRNKVLTPTPVKVEALKLNLPVKENLSDIKNLNADLGIVVAYGKIIPQAILDLLPAGCLNIHPSLLPKYRGPSPIQTAILNGDAETGVSIIKLDDQMDHGPIISKKQIPISNDDNYQTLAEKLSKSGADLLIKILPDYLAGKIKPEPQDDAQASYCRLIEKKDGQLDWSKSADDLANQIRAFQPWPGSFADFNGKKVEIIQAEVVTEESGEIGIRQNKNGQLLVRCGKNLLKINKLQPEGKKEMTAKEFINGYLK